MAWLGSMSRSRGRIGGQTENAIALRVDMAPFLGAVGLEIQSLLAASGELPAGPSAAHRTRLCTMPQSASGFGLVQT